jgi:uncharacterized protein YidB (DUF937 family)
MGLLDNLLSGAMQQMGQQGGNAGGNLGGMLGSMLGGGSGGGNAALLQIVASMLSNNGSTGGLGGLLQQFQQAGMGREMNSWIATGQNLPISLEQLTQVFGQGQMQQMAQRAGMDVNQFGGQLGELLPQVVDRLTPSGQMPQGGFDDALSALSKMMKG